MKAVKSNPFTPLRYRSVRLLWGAAVISDIGTWVQLIVVGSLVAAHTGSAVQTGLVALATFMPQGISSPVGGLLADRFDRRKVFARALMLQAFFTAVLAVVLAVGVRAPGVLTVIILLGSAAGSLGAPSYSAMQPDLVPPDELMAMVSLGVYSWNGGRIIGPILGTVLSLTIGAAGTVAFNAFSFVVMAVAVAMLRRPFLPKTADGSPRTDPTTSTVRMQLRDGYRALRTTPGCIHAVVLLVLYNLTAVPFMGLIPIYARAEFSGGTGLAGTVASAQGIGAIIGGVVLTMLATRRKRSYLVSRVVVGVSAALMLYAAAQSVSMLVPAAVLLGALAACMFISVSSVVQRDAPPAHRGRVMAIMQACTGVSYGIGLMFIGFLGDLTNLHVAFGAGAVLVLLAFWGLTIRSPRWREAFDGELAPRDPSLQAA